MTSRVIKSPAGAGADRNAQQTDDRIPEGRRKLDQSGSEPMETQIPVNRQTHTPLGTPLFAPGLLSWSRFNIGRRRRRDAENEMISLSHPDADRLDVFSALPTHFRRVNEEAG